MKAYLKVTSALLFAFVGMTETASAACARENQPQIRISGINSINGITIGTQNIRVDVTEARVTENGSTFGCYVNSTVELRIDYRYVGRDRYTWNTAQGADGIRIVTAEVTDNYGGRDSVQVRVNVRNNYVRPEVFNAEFYAWANPDVEAAFGTDPNRLLTHWLIHGIHEGRWSSPSFNSSEYLAINGDVNAAFGGNRVSALDHYIQFGINEGRQASLLFDVRHYMAIHGDLQDAYGANNWAAATNHYLIYGVNEGRTATPGFSGGSYLARHGDLQAAYGWNPKRAVAHWIIYGSREGRNPTP